MDHGEWDRLSQRWKIVGATFALLAQRRWYVRKYSAGRRNGWLNVNKKIAEINAGVCLQGLKNSHVASLRSTL